MILLYYINTSKAAVLDVACWGVGDPRSHVKDVR